MKFILDKIKKSRLKRTFNEYESIIDTFNIEGIGEIKYAHWLHPSNNRITISKSNVDFYRKIVSPGAMLIDIGSYVGDTTIPMALAVGKEGLVLALEPNPYVYKVLEKNAVLNPEYTHIVPLNFAATSEDGEFTFNYSDASFCNGGFLSQIKKKRHGHKYDLKVKGKNLQAFLEVNYTDELEKLALVKIDAEGYDKEIIKSLSEIFSKYKPAILVECYKRLDSTERDELYDLLDGLGYLVYQLDELEVEGKTLINKDQMSDKKHFDILAIAK